MQSIPSLSLSQLCLARNFKSEPIGTIMLGVPSEMGETSLEDESFIFVRSSIIIGGHQTNGITALSGTMFGTFLSDMSLEPCLCVKMNNIVELVVERIAPVARSMNAASLAPGDVVLTEVNDILYYAWSVGSRNDSKTFVGLQNWSDTKMLLGEGSGRHWKYIIGRLGINVKAPQDSDAMVGLK